ncbi:hypothetical protein [Noviluteimonas gilva]|uniref:Uncharacterized protein n=1 Tax=Noviluteimonas gilva TaxID=2682097 RepID=A0A7C9HWU0_9GAMM|nr:hypothetical protein [Lysobacter gilvus]MUV15498.1 hypothetical protein [Lysobacter gilvus]
MLSDRAKVETRREWQELGFYYDRDDEIKSWRIVGAKSGLSKFADLIRRYAADERNQGVSEHEHFGPYSYLEIGTWDVPEITEHWIAGPLDRLRMLASTIDGLLATQRIGQRASLRSSFSPASPYDLEIDVRSEDFDPASEDPNFLD